MSDYKSLDFVLLEVGTLDLFDVLIVSHDHEFVEGPRTENRSRIKLERRRAELLDNSRCGKKKKTGQGDDMEVSSLVSLVLPVEVH